MRWDQHLREVVLRRYDRLLHGWKHPTSRYYSKGPRDEIELVVIFIFNPTFFVRYIINGYLVIRIRIRISFSHTVCDSRHVERR